MNPGYFSEEAVKDLLAVKNGEIDYLKKTIVLLTFERNSLQEQVTNLQELKCSCS
jgi:hypothetical protein